MDSVDFKKNRLCVNDIIIALLIFLGAMNIYLFGIYLFAAASIYILLVHKSIKIPSQILPIFIFTVIYFIFVLANPNVGVTSSIKIFVCPLVWLAGYTLLRDKNINRLILIILSACMGMAVHGVLNFIYNLRIGTVFYEGKSYDVWSNSLSAATGQAINFSLLAAVLMWGLFMQKNLILKLVVSALYIAAFVYNIMIGGRSFVILTLLGIVIPLIIYSFIGNNKIFVKKVIPIILTVVAILAIIWVMYENNVFGMQDAFESSYFYRRFFSDISQQEITNDSRFDRKLLYFQHMLDYPFGGNHLRNELGIGYSHDLWLDVFDDAGIFAYIALWIYTISAGIRTVKFALNKRITPELRVLISTIFAISFIQFFVEPILQGAPMMFYSILIIDGMLMAYSIRSNE